MRHMLATFGLALALASPSSAGEGPAPQEKEVERLREELKKAEDKAALLAAENKKLRDAAHSEELRSRAMAERVKLLEARLEAAVRGAVKGGAPPAAPKESVSGEVVEVAGGEVVVQMLARGGRPASSASCLRRAKPRVPAVRRELPRRLGTPERHPSRNRYYVASSPLAPWLWPSISAILLSNGGRYE